jgi:hypothetical protein
MKEKIEYLLKELKAEVQLKELELSDIVKDVPVIVSILKNGFIRMKSLIADYEFKDKLEEIVFFKKTKPQLFCKLIYYKKVHNLELHRPVCGYDTIKAYLEREQEHLNDFYKENNDFIQYYRLGKTLLDEYYFLRHRDEMGFNLECFSFERDPNFSTNYDFKVAKLLANDMFAIYLNTELIKLKQNEYQIDNSIDTDTQEKWTDPKTALVEIIYAIHTEKSVNYGNIDLKVLAAKFGKIFNIDLREDIYRIFLEIRGRKGNRAVYLKRLMDALNRRMEEADSK